MKLSMRQKRADKKALLLAALPLLFCGFSAEISAEELVPFDQYEKSNANNSLRWKRLGDQAFFDGNYVDAIRFYKRYKKDTSRVADELEYAYEALITSYINVFDYHRAEAELKNYIVDVGAGVEKLDYYKAEIFRIKKEYKGAIAFYNKVLKTVRPTNRFYYSTLNGLGLSHEGIQDWENAVSIYEKVEINCPSEKWRIRATKQKLFAMIKAGQFDKVEAILDNPETVQRGVDPVDLDLYRIYIYSKKTKFDKLAALYKQISSKIRIESYPLCYKVDMQVANDLREVKLYEAAIGYLEDAYSFATVASERQDALKTTINTYEAFGDKQSAIQTAERFLNYYSDSEEVPNIRLQMARLLYSIGNVERSLGIYQLIHTDGTADIDIKLTAANESAFIYIEEAMFDAAAEKFKFIFEYSGSEAQKGEAEYSLTNILYIKKEDAKAYKEFIRIADFYRSVRTKCLFKAMYASSRMEDYNSLKYVSQLLIDEVPETEAGIEALFFHALACSELGEDQALTEFKEFKSKHEDHKYLDHALFKIGNLQFKSKLYREASESFSELIENHKQSTMLANAFYKRAYSYYFTGENKKAVNDVLELANKHRESKFTLHALNWLVDFYLSSGDYKDADGILIKITEYYSSDAEIMATTLLTRSQAALKNGNEKLAALLADEVMTDYAESSAYVDAIFTRANIHSAVSEYTEAIAKYETVFKKSEDQFTKTSARGRIGDCSFSLYSSNFENSHLEKAVEMYTYVLNQTGISADFRFQSLFKIGKCYETLGQIKKAVDKYKELNFDYRSAPSGNHLWFVKASNALASLYLSKGDPESAKSAIKIYRILVSMKIEPITDYKEEIIKIKQKFKL